MATYFFAFVERLTKHGWQLAHPLVVDDCQPSCAPLIPNNIAPPWGWDSIEHYTLLSGERGLPDDMNAQLRDYIVRAWGNEAYGASWLTLAEIEQLRADPAHAECDHFNPDWLLNEHTTDENLLRVIFWHD